MPIYLWEGKILVRSDFGDKIAVHENCCCDAGGPWCKFNWRNTYDCDLGTWEFNVSIDQFLSASCEVVQPVDAGWVYNAGLSTSTTCVYDRVTAKAFTCTPPLGPECSPSILDPSELPELPGNVDLDGSCPCYEDDCGGLSTCSACSRCYFVGGSIASVAQQHRDMGVPGTGCRGLGCIWGSILATTDYLIECEDGFWVIDDTFGNVWKKSVAGNPCPPAGPGPGSPEWWPKVGGGAPIDVYVYDCPCFLLAQSCLIWDGFGWTPAAPDGGTFDLADWEGDGCPDVFKSTGGWSETYCWDIDGGVVDPNDLCTGMATVSGNYADCPACWAETPLDGYYYLVDYEHHTTSTTCSGPSTAYYGVCVQYNGTLNKYVNPANGHVMGPNFFDCVDQGDGTSTIFYGVIAGPYASPTCT